MPSCYFGVTFLIGAMFHFVPCVHESLFFNVHNTIGVHNNINDIIQD